MQHLPSGDTEKFLVFWWIHTTYVCREANISIWSCWGSLLYTIKPTSPVWHWYLAVVALGSIRECGCHHHDFAFVSTTTTMPANIEVLPFCVRLAQLLQGEKKDCTATYRCLLWEINFAKVGPMNTNAKTIYCPHQSHSHEGCEVSGALWKGWQLHAGTLISSWSHSLNGVGPV